MKCTCGCENTMFLVVEQDGRSLHCNGCGREIVPPDDWSEEEDSKDSEISRLTAELERVKGELDSVQFKAHAWDNLWESCKEWAEATEAHDHRSGTERTVESLLDFAKQNKRLRSDLAAAHGAVRVIVVGEPDERGICLTKTGSGSFPWVWERDGRYWERSWQKDRPGRWRDGTYDTGAFKQAEYETIKEAMDDYQNAARALDVPEIGAPPEPKPTPPRRDPEDFIEHRNGPEVKQ